MRGRGVQAVRYEFGETGVEVRLLGKSLRGTKFTLTSMFVPRVRSGPGKQKLAQDPEVIAFISRRGQVS